jgi:hypothetical protein
MYKLPRKTENEHHYWIQRYRREPISPNDGTTWRASNGKIKIEGWFGTDDRGFEVHVELTRSDLLEMTRVMFRELEKDLREARKLAKARSR